MNKIIITSLCCLAILFSKGQDQMIVDANASVRKLPATFSSIIISNAIKVFITQSDTESLAVSATEEKYKDEIKTEIENNILKIHFSGNNNWRSKDRHLKVYVSFKTLSMINVSGASDVMAIGEINVKDLRVNVSGASTVKGEFYTDKMELDLSGASKAVLIGKTAMLSITSSGASDVEAFKLETSICNVSASGASDIDVYVEEEINATASGASNIKYKGSAAIKNMKASGAASISRRE